MPLYLTLDDIGDLNNNKAINDHHVEAALVLLRKQFPDVGGLHSWNIFQIGDGFSPTKKNQDCITVQIHKCSENHWVVSCTNLKEIGIFVYDSQLQLQCGTNSKMTILSDLELQLSTYYEASDLLHVRVPEGQQLCSPEDSGLFALAWIYELCNGKKPETIRFTEKKMRSHLLKCFETEKFISFPQRKICTTPKIHDLVVPLLCYCKRPPHFDWKLTSCSSCSNWFHNRCCDGPTTQDWICRNCEVAPSN